MTNTHHSDGAISVKINEVEIIHQTIQGPQGPRGERGEPGPVGPKGENGKSATITIGQVTQGDTPSVTNSGTASDVVLDFVLPASGGGAYTDILSQEQVDQLNVRQVYLRIGNHLLQAQEIRQTPYTFPVSLINAEQQHDPHRNTIIKLFDVNDVISEQEQADGWWVHDNLFNVTKVDGLGDFYGVSGFSLHLSTGATGTYTITHPHFDGALTVNIALAP